ERVDDAAHVLDRDIVDELDMAGLGVDRDVGGVGAVAVGALVALVGGFRRQSGEITERKRAPVAAAHRAGLDRDRVVGAAEPGGGAAAVGRAAGSGRAATTMALPPITTEREL